MWQGRYKIISISAPLLALLLIYQACGKSYNFLDPVSLSSNASSGNGESYGGKPTAEYVRYSEEERCQDVGRDGKPLPNQQIYYYTDRRILLVRDACLDIKPRLLNPSDVQLATDGSKELIYQNVRYPLAPDRGDLDVLAAQCPVGYQAIAGATRTNLVPNAQDMSNISTWWNHVGVVSIFEGVIASLPAFEVQRDDPGLLEYWRRAHFTMKFKPLTAYAFSFYGKPATVNEAWFSTFDENNQGTLSIIFDLNGGAPTIYENLNFTNVSMTKQTLGQATLYTTYFTTPAAMTDSVFGITPNGLRLSNGTYVESAQYGDSIVVSTLQLEEVDSFCTKP